MRKISLFFLITVLVLTTCVFAVGAENAELTTVDSWNLTLTDEIAANFYVNIADGVASDATMKVTDGYGTWYYPVTDAEQDQKGNYIFTARIAAAQMTDTISLQLVSGKEVGTVHTYCAADYGRYIMDNSNSDSTKALVLAMLNYGARAQLYFEHNTDNLANAGYVTDCTADMPASADVIVNGKANGVTFYGATLLFQSKVTTRFYFTVTGDINTYTFATADDSTYEAVYKNGLYYVDVPGILPQDYAQTIEMSVTDGTDALQISYSPMYYISRMYAKSESEVLRNLMVAMYQYHTVAVAYLEEAQTEVYNIQYNGLSGASHNNPATYTAATAAQIVLEAPSARYGYRFDGWYVDDTLVTSLEGWTGDVTLTAKWTLINDDIELPDMPIK